MLPAFQACRKVALAPVATWTRSGKKICVCEVLRSSAETAFAIVGKPYS